MADNGSEQPRERALKRAEVLRLLAEHRTELEAMGVKSLAVFGSVARDEAGPESDVDLLVEFSRPTGLFGFFEVQERLEQILGTRVDLGTPLGLKPRMRERVLRETVRVI
jgi:predicted nucleotidyltransferase